MNEVFALEDVDDEVSSNESEVQYIPFLRN